MFFLYAHLASVLVYAACYGLLARHAGRASPETSYLYWLLAAASIVHLVLAARIAYRRWRWCRWRMRKAAQDRAEG